MAEEVPLAAPASEESTQRSTDPRSALLAAILSYNIEAVRHLLSDECLSALREAFGEEVSDQELRTSLLTQDGTTTSLLMTACSIGNYEAVEVLVQNGAPVDAVSPSGNTALFYACRSGRSKTLEYLVSKGASVKAQNVSKDNLLMFSAAGSSQEHPEGSDPSDFPRVVLFLLNSGLLVNSANANGLNVLHCASDSISVVETIINWASSDQTRKSAITEALRQPTTLGDTPLHNAATDSNEKVIQLFLTLGADPLARNKAGKNPLQCTRNVQCLALLKPAEAAAQAVYFEKQEQLLRELDETPEPIRSKTASKKKGKGAKKSATPTSFSTTGPSVKNSDVPEEIVPWPSSYGSRVNFKASSDASMSVENHPMKKRKSEQAVLEQQVIIEPTPSSLPTEISWASIAKKTATAPVSAHRAGEPTLTHATPSKASTSGPVTFSLIATDLPPELGFKEPTIEMLEEKLSTDHPTASVLGLKVMHLLGLNLHSLSMEQLVALEEIHRIASRELSEAKLDFVRRQERTRYEEELSRRQELEKIASRL